MHGPDPEKQNCILSTTSNETGMEEQPPLGRELRPQEQVGQHPVPPRSRAGSGGPHLGHSSQEGVGFPISRTALLCRSFSLHSLWTKFSVPLLPHPSSFWGLFPSPVPCTSLSFVCPLPTFLSLEKPGWDMLT